VYLYTSFNLSARWASVPCPGHFTHGEKDAVPIVWEVGWAPGPVWIGVENFAPLGFDLLPVQPIASWPVPVVE
jgi:hypothetical protein